MIRLWHQSLTDLSLLPAYRSALAEHCRRAAPGVEVDVHGVSEGTYASRYPGPRIAQVYLQSLHKEQYIDAALTAEASGYDGFVLATIPDLAIEEIRSLIDIPVVGLGEASFKLASMLGSCAGVLSFDMPRLEPQLRRNATRYGMPTLLGPMVSTTVDFQAVIDELDAGNPGPVLEAITTAGRELIAQGADVIIPGPGPMNLLTARHGLSRIDDVPVVDSLRAAVELCSMLARMKQDGLYVTRRGFYWERPGRDELTAARAAYGRQTP